MSSGAYSSPGHAASIIGPLSICILLLPFATACSDSSVQTTSEAIGGTGSHGRPDVIVTDAATSGTGCETTGASCPSGQVLRCLDQCVPQQLRAGQECWPDPCLGRGVCGRGLVCLLDAPGGRMHSPRGICTPNTQGNSCLPGTISRRFCADGFFCRPNPCVVTHLGSCTGPLQGHCAQPALEEEQCNGDWNDEVLNGRILSAVCEPGLECRSGICRRPCVQGEPGAGLSCTTSGPDARCSGDCGCADQRCAPDPFGSSGPDVCLACVGNFSGSCGIDNTCCDGQSVCQGGTQCCRPNAATCTARSDCCGNACSSAGLCATCLTYGGRADDVKLCCPTISGLNASLSGYCEGAAIDVSDNADETSGTFVPGWVDAVGVSHPPRLIATYNFHGGTSVLGGALDGWGFSTDGLNWHARSRDAGELCTADGHIGCRCADGSPGSGPCSAGMVVPSGPCVCPVGGLPMDATAYPSIPLARREAPYGIDQLTFGGDPWVTARGDHGIVAYANLGYGRFGDPDMIVVSLSNDGGETFNRTQMANDAVPPDNGVDQTGLAFDPTDGSLWVTWVSDYSVGFHDVWVRGGTIEAGSIHWLDAGHRIPAVALAQRSASPEIHTFLERQPDGSARRTIAVVYARDTYADVTGDHPCPWQVWNDQYRLAVSPDGGSNWTDRAVDDVDLFCTENGCDDEGTWIQSVSCDTGQQAPKDQVKTPLRASFDVEMTPDASAIGGVRPLNYWVTYTAALPRAGGGDPNSNQVRVYRHPVATSLGTAFTRVLDVPFVPGARFQFAPVVVTNAGGGVAVFYYQTDSTNMQATGYALGSSDSGATWSPAIQLFPFRVFLGDRAGIGDYESVIAVPSVGSPGLPGLFYPVWTSGTANIAVNGFAVPRP